MDVTREPTETSMLWVMFRTCCWVADARTL